MERVVIEPKAQLLEQALDDVLTGPAFRSSLQCQALLRYIVEQSSSRHDEMLRERVIGMNVFGRAPDYDTGNDPVVRSRAAEVRKRLAQHYMHHAKQARTLRIDIPSGSYRAVFEISEADQAFPGTKAREEAPENQSQSEHGVAEIRMSHDDEKKASIKSSANPLAIATSRRTLLWTSWGVGILLIILGVALVVRYKTISERQPPFSAFWAPIVGGRTPLIFIGANHTYMLSNDFLSRYRAEHHMGDVSQGVEFFVELNKGNKIDESDLVPLKSFIGFGDVAAAARFSSMLARFGKNYDLRYGENISISDLQASPTILIGGFSNAWSLELMHQLPFRLTAGDQIIDSRTHGRFWKRKNEPGTVHGDDYAVITRLLRAETGNFALDIAGIDTYSNQAAADFLSDQERLSAFLRTLPLGWENHNMQIVLHSTVVAGVPAVVNVEAAEVW